MMRSSIMPWALLLGVALAGCAPATRVVLLPEAGATTGVDVRNAQGEVVSLNRPYAAVDVAQGGRLTPTTVSPLQIMDRYGMLLAQTPPPPERYTLNFETGSAELTAESRAQLPDILARAKARLGGEIIVVAHTDRVGSVEANDALSLTRARAVRDRLVAAGFEPNRVVAVGRGEREPLVPTADEVAEPKNRRAELLIQ